MNNFFLVLPTFWTFCPDGVLSAQMGSLFAHFQVQALLAVHHMVTVKLLYTSTLQWGLKVATHCCVIVHQFFIWDQPDTTEISQMYLASTVQLHCGLLGCYWGQNTCCLNQAVKSGVHYKSNKLFWTLGDNTWYDSLLISNVSPYKPTIRS